MHARYGGGHSCLVQVFCCCCLNLVFAAAQLQVVHDERKRSDDSDLYVTLHYPTRRASICKKDKALTNHNYKNGKGIYQMQVNSCSQLLVGPVFSCLFGSWFSCSCIQFSTIMFMASSELMISY